MVAFASALKSISEFSILDSLDMVSFQNPSLSSPSMKPTIGDEALCVKPMRRAGDGEEEDAKSFKEEYCLFMEGSDGEDDDVENGAFCHYTWTEDVHVNNHHSSPYDIVLPASRPPTRARKPRRNMLSVRESLLVEAWERKREVMLQEEMVNMRERATPGLIGRCSSDCSKRARGVLHEELRATSRTRSLTDHDFEEVRGFMDLGFRFDKSVVPDLCDTLPALQVFCAAAQSVQEKPSHMIANSSVMSSPTRCYSFSPMSPSWRVSSPGDDPKEVKGRLRYWAQAVACKARLCY